MKEIAFDVTVNEIEEVEQDVLFLIAPNYEVRSLSWQKELDLLNTGSVQHRHLLVGMITLQAEMHQNAILEKLKWQHIAQTREYLKERERHLFSQKHETLTYPHDFSVGTLKGVLKSWTRPLKHPFTVYLDLSGLPRKVILSFMAVLHGFVRDGYVARLFLLYAWPVRYPRVGRPANVGGLKMGEDNMNLSRFIENVSDVKAVLVPGREGYSGRLFMDSLPPNARVDTYIYMEKDNPMSSLRTVYANSSLLSEVEVRTNANLHYFLSIPRGHQMLVDNASQAALEWKQIRGQNVTRAYIVAPFGPKPMLVSGYIANLIFGQSGIPAGIVLLTGHQYSDLYSVGCSHVSCFEVDLKELITGKDDDN